MWLNGRSSSKGTLVVSSVGHASVRFRPGTMIRCAVTWVTILEGRKDSLLICWYCSPEIKKFMFDLSLQLPCNVCIYESISVCLFACLVVLSKIWSPMWNIWIMNNEIRIIRVCCQKMLQIFLNLNRYFYLLHFPSTKKKSASFK